MLVIIFMHYIDGYWWLITTVNSLQIKQMKNGTSVSQGKYIKDMLKKFGMDDAKAG